MKSETMVWEDGRLAPACEECFPAATLAGRLSFRDRGEAFAVFAGLLQQQRMPAMCEQPEGGCRVCWGEALAGGGC